MKKLLYKNPAIAIVMVFLLIFIITALSYLLFFSNPKTIGRNVFLGELNLENLTIAEAEEKLAKRIKDIEDKGLVFTYKTDNIIINPKVIAFGSELSYEVFSIEKDASLENVFNQENNNLFFKLFPNFDNKEKKVIKAKYRIHQERFNQTLNKLFLDYEIKAENAYFKFSENEELIIVPEIIGVKLNLEENFQLAKKSLDNLSLNDINLNIIEIKPKVSSIDLRNKKEMALELLENNSFSLNFNSKEFAIEKTDIVEWLMFVDNEVFLNEEKIEIFLQFEIAPEIDRLAKMPEFNIEDEKVIDWQPGTSGRKLLIDENIINIQENLLSENSLELLVEEIFYDEAEGLASEIKEIIGTGHSNFSGSPYNRVHNIKLGASIYHGLIIKPNEEFSTLKYLGPINRETGYLPELVIKDGETIPEYGGGLCQISTTLFRTALQAGLPITARQPHSFRVSYYEPAGTDASIYNPWPDLKFVNDTPYHILIQARIEGVNLYFDFWSTNDGREVEVTDPIIYNITPPPPTKYIETDDLEPGVKRCTENAHNGANTHFDYRVLYPNGELAEERFHSYYVPWQAVCLIGREIEEEEEELIENEEEENNQ